MAFTKASANSNELGNQLDFKSPLEEICAHTTGRSSSYFQCPPWTLPLVDGINSESTRSPLSEAGLTSFEKNPLLGMFMSHFAAAFTKLELLGPESSLSARFDDLKRFPNSQLQNGTVFLRKNHVAVENDSNVTEIRISWEKGKPDEESEVNGLKLSDTTIYNNHVKFSGSIQSFTAYYNVTLDSYTGYENDASHMVYRSSALSEMATKVYGDLYHRSGETGPMAHWTICCPISHSWAGRWSATPKRCIDIPVSYEYSFSRGETLVFVAIRVNMCTTAIIQLSFQDFDHCTTEDSVDRKANRVDVDTQTSISNQRLSLKADCRYVIKKEGAMKHQNTFDQQRMPGRIKAAMSKRESSTAEKNLGTSQTQSRSKPEKRRKDSEDLESQQTTPKNISTKKTKVLDDAGSLACPFYKMDPWKFDRCLTYKLSKMSYVKQHLLRCHYALHCSCPICQFPRSNKAERDYHTGSKYCQKRQYILYVMTAEQVRDIQCAAGRKITCEGKWYQIWSILFPGARKPDSPFVKDHYFAEVLSSIQAFYHNSRSRLIEETFRQVMKDSHTYHEAFEGLLKKIEHQALTQSLGLGSSFHFNSSIEIEHTDWSVARRSPLMGTLSADNKEALLFSSTQGGHNLVPIPSAESIEDEKQKTPSHLSETLTCNVTAQEIPSIRSGVDAIDSYGMGLESPDTSWFHQTNCPIPYQETSSLTPEPQNMIDLCQMGALFEFTSLPSSPTSADLSAEIPDWVAD